MADVDGPPMDSGPSRDPDLSARAGTAALFGTVDVQDPLTGGLTALKAEDIPAALARLEGADGALGTARRLHLGWRQKV